MTISEPSLLRPRGSGRHLAPAIAPRTPDTIVPTRRARRSAERTADAGSPPVGPGPDAVSTAVDPVPPARRGRTAGPDHGLPAGGASTPVAVQRVDPPHVRAVAPAAAPARTRAAARATEHHRRRAARPVTALVTTVARSVSGSVRATAALAHGVSVPSAVPVTATALVACLVVPFAAPQSAVADISESPSTGVYDFGQDYTAPSGPDGSVSRDGFGATAAPPPPPAASVTTGGPVAAVPAGVAFVRPVAGDVPAAGGFGSRWVRGCGACSTNHQGLDFAAPTGTPIVSAMAGTVVHAGVEGGYGNSVVVQHANGVQTRYGHMSVVAVRVGQVVPVGGRLGAVGSTGVSTGSHLHFEVIVGGAHVDPAGWLRARGLL